MDTSHNSGELVSIHMYVYRTPEQPKCMSIKQSFTDEWFNMCGQGYCSSYRYDRCKLFTMFFFHLFLLFSFFYGINFVYGVMAANIIWIR